MTNSWSSESEVPEPTTWIPSSHPKSSIVKAPVRDPRLAWPSALVRAKGYIEGGMHRHLQEVSGWGMTRCLAKRTRTASQWWFRWRFCGETSRMRSWRYKKSFRHAAPAIPNVSAHAHCIVTASIHLIRTPCEMVAFPRPTYGKRRHFSQTERSDEPIAIFLYHSNQGAHFQSQFLFSCAKSPTSSIN